MHRIMGQYHADQTHSFHFQPRQGASVVQAPIPQKWPVHSTAAGKLASEKFIRHHFPSITTPTSREKLRLTSPRLASKPTDDETLSFFSQTPPTVTPIPLGLNRTPSPSKLPDIKPAFTFLTDIHHHVPDLASSIRLDRRRESRRGPCCTHLSVKVRCAARQHQGGGGGPCGVEGGRREGVLGCGRAEQGGCGRTDCGAVGWI